MKITRHHTALAAGASAAALLLAACSSSSSGGSGSSASAAGSPSAATSTTTSTATSAASSAPATNISIAGVYGNTPDPFWASLGCGAKKEAATLGVKYQDFAGANLDTSTFSQNFSAASATNPSGIFVNPANPNQFVTQYGALMKKGVPVVTINGTTPPAQLKIVGTDTTDTSFLSDVAALVPTGTTGKLQVVNGVPGLVPVQSRLDPVVKAILGANTGLKLLKPIYSGFDINKATSAVSSAIIANPDLKVIVAADGPDGAAAAAAVKTAGKTGKITVIALDAVPPEVQALKDGIITGLVAQAPAQIGAKQVDALVDYLKANTSGGPVTPTKDFVGVPQKLLTKANVDDPTNADWVYVAKC
jgi:ribose transport system substrate-binding protein